MKTPYIFKKIGDSHITRALPEETPNDINECICPECKCRMAKSLTTKISDTGNERSRITLYECRNCGKRYRTSVPVSSPEKIAETVRNQEVPDNFLQNPDFLKKKKQLWYNS